jgi:hypothetical protein
MDKAKACPKCGSDDLWIDSAANAASWVQCNVCEFRLQGACCEEDIVERWNDLERIAAAPKLAGEE